MRSGGTERSYKLHLPQGLPQGAPLVVVLHGYGANNDPGRFGMNAAADRHGFAVCYPQGAKDGRGKTCWNVGYPFQADMAIDDVEFITQLVRHLQKNARAEPPQRLLHGHVERRGDVLPACGAAPPPVRGRGTRIGADARMALQGRHIGCARAPVRNTRHGRPHVGVGGRPRQ